MIKKQPRWYQEAIIYELHIRAFFDSNDDGTGDFRGLIQKLDYLQDLGVTAIWLLPFYPSPLKDDGYDIAEYTDVHPAYGNLADFKLFLREAHKRNLRVITELVLNHTSDQHPWFQRARRAKPASYWRNFYIWNNNDAKYPQARIIFKDFETSNWTWDPVAQSYYWHRFYSHQPDLNYDHPPVQKAVYKWVDFWLNMGVDGLRLDAVPYLFKREGTHCENLPETHQFLKKLRQYIDEKFPDRMLLAEANQWPEDSIAYFGSDDECNMAFHFPLMPRMYMALQMEDRFPLTDIIEQTPKIPETCQWAIFLRNHDELTLEMVSEKEREYMYQAYAQDPQSRINLGIRRRLAPLLNNSRKKIELMNSLLFSFPGTPVIYYGDEIGMGDNFYLNDRDSVRTPMQWNSDTNAGFSQAHPHQLFLPINTDPEYHYKSVNVATQKNNPESLLCWMKQIIALRKQYRALSLGSIHFLYPENSKILAYIIQYQDEKILVLANLANCPQYTQLDLQEWQGLRLIELFSGNLFPSISEKPYLFTLGAHDFYWFLLDKSATEKLATELKENQLPKIDMNGEWNNILQKTEKHKLEAILPIYLLAQRWFNQKSKQLKKAIINEIIPVNTVSKIFYILFVTIIDAQEKIETYILPISFIDKMQAKALARKTPTAFLADLPAQKGYLVDAFYDADFTNELLKIIVSNRKLKGQNGIIQGVLRTQSVIAPDLTSHPLSGEQSNTCILFAKNFILKNYRRCQPGIHPELEMLEFLTKQANFGHTPELSGILEYKNNQNQVISLGILQKYCKHQFDAWEYFQKKISHFLEKILKAPPSKTPQLLQPQTSSGLFSQETIPEPVQTLLGDYEADIRLLGERTAEMHIALASKQDSSFTPEAFSALYQRNLYQSIRSELGRTLTQLRRSLPNLTQSAQAECQAVFRSAPAIEACIQQLINRPMNAMLMRIHGDFHLGQVLYTGKDFVIIDFEGEPERSLVERRGKRSPLCDIAGMLRSLDYTAQSAATHFTLYPWASFWRHWMSIYFINEYRKKTINQPFLPDHKTDLDTLLHIFLVEKAIYEIQYELNNRPDWLAIPCRGLLELFKHN